MIYKETEFYEKVSTYMENMANALLHLGMSLNRFHFYNLSLTAVMLKPKEPFFGVETMEYFNGTSQELVDRFEKVYRVNFF